MFIILVELPGQMQKRVAAVCKFSYVLIIFPLP